MTISRKILFATVFVSLGLVSALPIAVNIRYKNRSFVDDTKNEYDYYKLKPAPYVLVKDLNNLVIVPSDSFRVEVATVLRNAITISNNGDTLSLIYTDKSTQQGSAQVILYLPKVQRLISRESIIQLKGGVTDLPPPPSFAIDLYASDLSILTFTHHQFFNQLEITGFGQSRLIIAEHNHIWELNLKNLERATIDASVELRKVNTIFDGKGVVGMRRDENILELKSTTQ